jgi:hypothetical protein
VSATTSGSTGSFEPSSPSCGAGVTIGGTLTLDGTSLTFTETQTGSDGVVGFLQASCTRPTDQPPQ